ncbi:MAG: hypothetical protein O2877_02015, partial [bacterium]|nr:hypothetical protein [bacterium]
NHETMDAEELAIRVIIVRVHLFVRLQGEKPTEDTPGTILSDRMITILGNMLTGLPLNVVERVCIMHQLWALCPESTKGNLGAAH